MTGLASVRDTVAEPVNVALAGVLAAPRAVLSRNRTVADGTTTADVSVVTENVQDAEGSTIVSADPDTQLPPVTTKLLGLGTVVNELLAMTRGAVPILVTVTIWGGAATPTGTLPKVRVDGEICFSDQPTVELNRTSPVSAGTAPSQCWMNVAAKDTRLPEPSALSSSIVNEPASALHPLLSPEMSIPGCPAVRETLRTAPE